MWADGAASSVVAGPGDGVFLDRDGVVNKVIFRKGTPSSPRTVDEFELEADAHKSISRLKAAGFKIFVVSNQPDLSRGFLTASALDAMLSEEGHRVDVVIALVVPEGALVDRILHRAAVEGRADDTREAIAERMHEYHTLTAAVLDYYRQRGVRVEEINGTGDVDAVLARVKQALR